MRCESCGADIPAEVDRCEYCGQSCETAVPASAEGPFAGIKQSAAYARRHSSQRLAELPSVGALQTVVPQVFALVFAFVGGVMSLAFLGVGGGAAMAFGPCGLIPVLFTAVPLFFVWVGIKMFLTMRQRAQQIQTAPMLAQAAVLVGKRTSTSGGGEHSSVQTHYHLTFEFEDGSRRELTPLDPRLFGELSERDAGVLYSKHDLALGFDRARG